MRPSPPPSSKWTANPLRIASNKEATDLRREASPNIRSNSPAASAPTGLFNQGRSQSLRYATALLHPLLFGIGEFGRGVPELNLNIKFEIRLPIAFVRNQVIVSGHSKSLDNLANLADQEYLVVVGLVVSA